MGDGGELREATERLCAGKLINIYICSFYTYMGFDSSIPSTIPCVFSESEDVAGPV